MEKGFEVQIGVCWWAQGGKPYRQRAPPEPRRGGVKLLGLVGKPEPMSSVTLVEMSSSQKSRALLARPRGAGSRLAGRPPLSFPQSQISLAFVRRKEARLFPLAGKARGC